LPWFLSYYRKIGVDKFFIIDNDSDDGTADYLSNQKDVHLFWTDVEFNKAGQGMKWINDLILWRNLHNRPPHSRATRDH